MDDQLDGEDLDSIEAPEVRARGGDDPAHRVAVEGVADCVEDDSFDVEDPPPGAVPRGGRLLTDLADILRAAGLDAQEVDGWTTRSRSGNGFPTAGPLGIVVHHTASSASWDGQRDADFMTFQCDVKPMANLYLERSGRWWVLSAGATNTNGKGGPWGPIPKDSANSRVIGIEAGNNGVGEAWSDAMQDSYVRGVAALANHFGVAPGNILGHHEWAPTRKVDPAGPSGFGSVSGSGSWNMNSFRDAVNAARGGGGPAPVPQPTPTSTPAGAGTYVVQPGDSWWSIATKTTGDPAQNWPLLADANGGASRMLRPGDVVTIPGAGSAPSPDPTPSPGGVPAFPGTAKRPDVGPVVLTWQTALIATGVIRDTSANRDSQYGDGMHSAVFKLQQSWGWSDADGIAGKHTWSKLHGGS